MTADLDGGHTCHCGREADAIQKGYLAESPAGRGQCLDCAGVSVMESSMPDPGDVTREPR